ncbi:MAG: FixH family protein [Acidobacteriota bacterium]
MTGALLIRAVCACAVVAAVACGRDAAGPSHELQRTRAGDLDVVLLSSSDALQQGHDTAAIEFRRGADLVDVGAVRINAMMPMAGMAPMVGRADVQPTDRPGRYQVSTDLGMAGGWQLNIQWEGAAGRGSATLRASAR